MGLCLPAEKRVGTFPITTQPRATGSGRLLAKSRGAIIVPNRPDKGTSRTKEN